MAKSLATNGLGVIIVIGGVLYFTPAGSWVKQQMGLAGMNCHSALHTIGGESVAGPVCNGLASTVSFVEEAAEVVSRQTRPILSLIFPAKEGLAAYVEDLSDTIEDLSSPKERLKKMLADGPWVQGDLSTIPAQYQYAVDSHTIGQSYLNNRTTAELGLPWLERAARQPNGFGMMSQLSLGQAYASGDQGLPKNNGQAQAYLRQASQSLSILTSSNTPQARQILQSLPVAPQTLQGQIEQAIRQLQIQGR